MSHIEEIEARLDTLTTAIPGSPDTDRQHAKADAASTNLARSRSTTVVLGRLSRAAEHVAARAISHPARIHRMAGSLRIVRPFQRAEEVFEFL